MNVKRSLSRAIERAGIHTNRWAVDFLGGKLAAARYNIESQHYLPQLGLTFIPQTFFALSASAIRIILNDLVLHNRKHVLELGAGMSTLYLAKVMSERSGSQLVTVENDLDWIEHLRGVAVTLGCERTIRFVHAPLVPTDDPIGATWYDAAPLRQAISELGFVDTLLVDGPKARGPNDDATRKPALFFFREALNPAGSVVFLDDVGRAGERRIYDEWARTLNMQPVRTAEFCGLGILVPSDQPLRRAIV